MSPTAGEERLHDFVLCVVISDATSSSCKKIEIGISCGYLLIIGGRNADVGDGFPARGGLHIVCLRGAQRFRR
jgi:hypothetical protein